MDPSWVDLSSGPFFWSPFLKVVDVGGAGAIPLEECQRTCKESLGFVKFMNYDVGKPTFNQMIFFLLWYSYNIHHPFGRRCVKEFVRQTPLAIRRSKTTRRRHC